MRHVPVVKNRPTMSGAELRQHRKDLAELFPSRYALPKKAKAKTIDDLLRRSDR